MSWMSRRVRPPLARRTVSTRRRRPGRKRSWPMRSSGPLGTSRMPVASTTIAPGMPRAKRSYQSMISSVTKPSSVARHGTIAGTQVRCASATGPMSTGENRRDAAASAADGTRPAEAVNRIRCGGRHTVLLRGVRRSRRNALVYHKSGSPAGALPPAACHGRPKPIAMAPVAAAPRIFKRDARCARSSAG